MPWYAHNAELWCLTAAHEGATLISGSRWRVSNWEALPDSMYVTTKRMTLAESSLPFSHTEQTLCVLFHLCTSRASVSALTPTFLCAMTAGDDVRSSTVSQLNSSITITTRVSKMLLVKVFILNKIFSFDRICNLSKGCIWLKEISEDINHVLYVLLSPFSDYLSCHRSKVRTTSQRFFFQ